MPVKFSANERRVDEWEEQNDPFDDEPSDGQQLKDLFRREPSPPDIVRLLDACGNDEKQRHLRPILIFALNTGCRKEEMLSLRWQNVDLRHGFINITKTKNGESRKLPLNEPLREMLSQQIRRIGCEFVFYDPEMGRRFQDERRSFGTALRKAGITDFHFHDLRHTYASQMVMAGVDLTTVSRLLGHKTLAMTLRYSHLAPEHLSNAVDALAVSLGKVEWVKR